MEQLYKDLFPMCRELIDVGRGIAGFAALWFIAHRVWGHLSRAEPIDFYPLLRPFLIGFAILLFPAVINLINGVLQPAVTVTANMASQRDASVKYLLAQKQAAMESTDAWQMYAGSDGSGNRRQ